MRFSNILLSTLSLFATATYGQDDNGTEAPVGNNDTVTVTPAPVGTPMPTLPTLFTPAPVVEIDEGIEASALELLESDCPQIWQDFCKRESARYCFLDPTDEEIPQKCGTCLPGFVEFQARCLNEKEVDVVLWLAEYAPQFLEPTSMEQRGEFFLQVIQFIQEHQNKNPPPPYELEINEFSADGPDDIRDRTGFNPNITVPAEEDLKPQQPVFVQSGGGSGSSSQGPATDVDWVKLGAVTSVKDQGRCGCCWAVTLAGAVEGAVAVETGYLQSLSFQQWISCDDDNLGCNGGNLVYATIYAARDSGGISTEFDYEYTDYQGTTTETCDSIGRPAAVKVDGGNYVVDYYDDYSFEERMDRMKAALRIQPVAIVIKSACNTISSYKSGVITDDEACACTSPLCADHAVLLVGFNDDAEIPYWKIKNSWSERWGEDGYFRVSQQKKGDYGLFGVLLHGVVPEQAYNVTGQVVEPSSTSGSDLEWWVWLLIGIGALALCCCVFACFCGNRKR